jgi:hypothetical protein
VSQAIALYGTQVPKYVQTGRSFLANALPEFTE